ncbi:MAG TPA: STM4014 family protein [Planctomycetia bacterium]|nr:STM4014 family protein [Planctomycetia bacterium]
MRTLLVGVPGGRRAKLWQEALAARGWPEAEECTYAQAISGPKRLGERVTSGMAVRLESPDNDVETNAFLLRLGAESCAAEGGRPLGDAAAKAALAERGRIVQPRQWYLGFCAALAGIECELTEAPPRRLLNDPGEIATLYDKTKCLEVMAAAEAPIPPSARRIAGYDDLRARRDESPRGRWMVKLAHGSAAAGAMAVEFAGDRVRALTTAVSEGPPGEPKIYGCLRIRSIVGEAEVANLMEAMAPWGLHAEAWLPKDRWSCGRRYDLRVLTIDGKPRHAVARLSASPFTNLNLGNDRADASTFKERAEWRMIEEACTNAARAFPKSLHLGIDALVGPDGRSVHLLEANAFGDLLPGATDRGESALAAQLTALERR